VACNLGAVAAGASATATFTYTVTAAPGATIAGNSFGGAPRVTGAARDPNESNNLVAVSTSVLGPPPPGPRHTTTLRLRHVKLGAALRRGVPVTLTCADTCSFKVSLRLTSPNARRFQLARSVTVGRRTTRLSSAGTKTVRVKFTRRAKRHLAHDKQVKLGVRGVARVAGRSRRVVSSKRLTLKR
jgi:hypothetical protein